MEKYRISFIGAGKVAGALANKLYDTGYRIQSIVSKTEKTRQLLSDLCQASPKPDLDFTTGSDIVIAAVPDDVLGSIMNSVTCGDDVIIAHTAGSTGLEVYPSHIRHKAVFYPLQTFSENRKIEFYDIPFFIEASDDYTTGVLKDLAESIGGRVYFLDARHRRLLHSAAVFVSNFTNYMLIAGKKISNEAGTGFDVLKPLINETIRKALENGPEASQTGPAVRHDLGTIRKHMDILSFSTDLQHLYKEITESILKSYL